MSESEAKTKVRVGLGRRWRVCESVWEGEDGSVGKDDRDSESEGDRKEELMMRADEDEAARNHQGSAAGLPAPSHVAVTIPAQGGKPVVHGALSTSGT